MVNSEHKVPAKCSKLKTANFWCNEYFMLYGMYKMFYRPFMPGRTPLVEKLASGRDESKSWKIFKRSVKPPSVLLYYSIILEETRELVVCSPAARREMTLLAGSAA